MTLTTHAVVGAATAQLVSVNPVIGFFAGFLSHFVLDSIPHGHYPVYSHTRNANHLKEDIVLGRQFLFDIIKIGFDFCLGFALVILFFHAFGSLRFINIFAGALGGVLPDALQFAYYKIRKEPLTSLQRFHKWIHAKKHFDHQLGKAVLIESATIAFAVLVVKALLALAFWRFVWGFAGEYILVVRHETDIAIIIMVRWYSQRLKRYQRKPDIFLAMVNIKKWCKAKSTPDQLVLNSKKYTTAVEKLFEAMYEKLEKIGDGK